MNSLGPRESSPERVAPIPEVEREMPRYNPNTGQLESYQVGPFINSHAYLQWGGKLPGNETWSCGMRLRAMNPAVLVDLPGMLTAAKTAVQAFHASSSGGIQINSRALLSFVKLNAIDTEGHYIYPTTNEAIVADVPGGYVDATTIHPNQVALAVTLTTAVSRGPANKGRFYVPLPSYQIAADGMIGATYATNAETGVMTLVNAINAINASFKVAIFSRKQGAPAVNDVTGAKVGRVLDTQRRRRRKIAENYS